MKTTFFAKNFKIQGPRPPSPLSDAHDYMLDALHGYMLDALD